MKHGDRLLETLEQAHARVVARENARRLQPLDQQAREVRQKTVDPLHQRLKHQIVSVAIDHQPGQAIGFAVDEPVGGRIDASDSR